MVSLRLHRERSVMERYGNLGGNSNVLAYQIGDSYIAIRFAGGRDTIYSYTYESAGPEAVETMKALATAGHGLNSYISSKATQPDYFKKGNQLSDVI